MIEWNEKRKIMFWLEETGVYVKKLNINDLFFVSFLFFWRGERGKYKYIFLIFIRRCLVWEFYFVIYIFLLFSWDIRLKFIVHFLFLFFGCCCILFCSGSFSLMLLYLAFLYVKEKDFFRDSLEISLFFVLFYFLFLFMSNTNVS